MALQTDDLPASVDEAKVYVVKGKTLAKLIKKAKHKLVFSKEDFTVTEDDNKTTVKISASFRSGCGSSGGGSP